MSSTAPPDIASSDIAPGAPIESPCILVCVIEPVSGHCRGCGRTTREIGAWGMLSAEQRRAVMDELPARMDALPPPPRERRVNRRASRGRAPGTVDPGAVNSGTVNE